MKKFMLALCVCGLCLLCAACAPDKAPAQAGADNAGAMENGLPGIEPIVEDSWPESIGRENEALTAENLSFDIEITAPAALVISCVTESGKLAMEIKNPDGERIFNESDIQTADFEVNINASGTYKVVVQAQKHTGGFWLEQKNEDPRQ